MLPILNHVVKEKNQLLEVVSDLSDLSTYRGSTSLCPLQVLYTHGILAYMQAKHTHVKNNLKIFFEIKEK